MKVKVKTALLNTLRSRIGNCIHRFHCKAACAKIRSKEILTSNVGTGFFDSGIKVLIAVVIGALLLAAMYALFNGTIIPTVVQRVKDMFNYNG